MTDPLVKKCHEFKQVETRLFELMDQSNCLRQFLKPSKHFTYCAVSTLITIYLESGPNSSIFSTFKFDESTIDVGLDNLTDLMVRCYSYIRAVRRIQRWWRHQYYQPTGRGFCRAQNDFNLRCRHHGSNLS